MKSQSFSRRIALNYMATTAVLIVVIFASIYLVVYRTVYYHLNDDLDAESLEVANSIVTFDRQLIFANEAEWQENEHGQIEVNPTFVQVTDTLGNVIKRTPNLMGTSLDFRQHEDNKVYFNTRLSGGDVHQLQMVLNNENGQKIGYLMVAVPLEESQLVLRNLLTVLLIAFPVVLLILFFITKLIAEKSIRPVKVLTQSAEKITRENLNERIQLPVNRDELYVLTDSINHLLGRVEETLLREKQFSADASHELRTPLSALKGTLEVMIRKPRSADHYVGKITDSLVEVNRMSELVDQLLLLARYENVDDFAHLTTVGLEQVVHNILARRANDLEQKEITLDLNVGHEVYVWTDIFMVEQIIENIFSNAIKYSNQGQTIALNANIVNQQVVFIIRDQGVGMNKEELSRIFDRFYRIDQSRNSKIRGSGLGLAIAKRFADQLHIKIEVDSQPGEGTTFTLLFPTSDNSKI